MTALTYYCAAPNCEEVGKHFIGGRLFCDYHVELLRKCHCAEDRVSLLPGESCDKCGFTNSPAEAG